MLKESKIELKVGIFTLIGLVVLVVFIFLISDFRFFSPGYTIKLVFNFANGVKIGAPVRLAGVDVGEIKTIHVFRTPQMERAKIEIAVWLKKEALVPKDSRIQINTLGILGEKYVEILPGTDYNALVSEGGILAGDDPVSIQEISELSKNIALKLDKTIESLNAIVKDGQVTTSFREMINNLKEASGSLSQILNRIEKGEGSLGKLVTDDKIYNATEDLVEDIKKNPWKLLRRP
ncbi:MAG: MlaD family protein [Candidatus Omnitrophota bacterium]